MYLTLRNCSSSTLGENSVTSDVEEQEAKSKIPLEVFFFDQENRPPPSHPTSQLYPDLTYTAEVYIADHTTNQLLGPYLGSTFPNNKQSKNDQEQFVDRPKTVKSESG